MPTIPQLQQRYGLSSRQSVYNRIEHLEKLGLERNLEEPSRFLRELDSLHVYLQQKGAQMEGYTLDGQTAKVQVVEPERDGLSSGLDKSNGQRFNSDVLSLLDLFAARLASAPTDPLLPQRQLQDACDRGWQLSTSQLRAILGARPRPGDRYGFQLQRVGRIGKESAWSVKTATVAASNHQVC